MANVQGNPAAAKRLAKTENARPAARVDRLVGRSFVCGSLNLSDVGQLSFSPTDHQTAVVCVRCSWRG